jgi:PAS domain S-box-containing protein
MGSSTGVIASENADIIDIITTFVVFYMSRPFSEAIKVLYVDDNQQLTGLVSECLEREDDRITVETAGSATEGLDALSRTDFDCVVSDYNMPVTNGLDFLRDVPNLPFILYTGKGSEEVASEAISAGVTDYLQKGSGTSQYTVLANRIINAVKKHRSEERAETYRRIRKILRDVNHCLVRLQDSAEIEAEVCRVITQSEPYVLAWIGDHEPGTGAFAPRVSAGRATEYLEEVATPFPRYQDLEFPAGDTIETCEVTTIEDFSDSTEGSEWQTERQYGFHSAASLPLEYENVSYGVLNVYSNRPEFFGKRERELLIELSENITHALYRVQQENERRRFEQGVEESGHAVFLTDTEGTIEYVNSSFERITGYSETEAVGQNPRILKSGEMDDAYYEELWESLLGGEVWEEEVVNRQKSGELYTAHQTIAPIFDSASNPTGFLAIQADITEHKRRERKIRESERTYRDLFDGINDAVFIHTPDGEFLSINETACNRLGYSEAELLELSPADIDSSDHEDKVRERIEKIQVEGSLTFESVHVTATGEQIPVEIGASIIEYFGDEAILSIARDISEQKEKEQELTILSERLDLALEAGQLGVWDWNIETQAVTFDERWASMLGHSLDEIEPHIHEWERRAHPDDLPEAEAALEAHFAGETEYYECDHRMQTKSGDWIWVRDVGRVFEWNDDGDPVRAVGIHQNITKQKALEKDLQRQRDRSEQYFENAGMVMLLLDSNGNIERINQRGRDLLGYAEGELVGEDWFETVVPTDSEIGLNKLFDELRYENLDGIEVHENRVCTKEGNERILEWKNTLLRDASDEVIGVLSSGIDLTERRQNQAELRRQRDRLDEFASVVSHDLRNPLHVADARVNLLAEEIDSEHIGPIVRALDRMETIIEDTLLLARQGKTVAETESIGITELVQQCWQTMPTSEATVEVVEPFTLQGDRNRLTQLFENLFRNAIEHGREDVSIRTGPLGNSGFYIEDDGPGVHTEDQTEIFDIGYSTADEGTGFGLNIVTRIADAHNWEITLTDGTEGGARFEFN